MLVHIADVHMLLGDVAQETEAFERALTDYQEALQLFLGATPPDPRAIIAAHYNISITHHFLSNIPEALTHAEVCLVVVCLIFYILACFKSGCNLWSFRKDPKTSPLVTLLLAFLHVIAFTEH